MNEKEAMKRAAEKDAIEDREIRAFQSGWQAALEWRDSQAGEPCYLVSQRTPFFAELWQAVGNDAEIVAHIYGSTQSEIDKRVKILNFSIYPSAAQINHHLWRALEDIIVYYPNSTAADIAHKAITAAKEQTK